MCCHSTRDDEYMNGEFWIDGFNFFHHWDNTKGFLRSDSGLDIVKAMERSLRTLGRQLGGKCRQTVVYMDGGLSRHHAGMGALRIRYAGPGKKADDCMAFDLDELGVGARMVTGVTNDRELKVRLRLLGANCLGVGEFLSLLQGRRKPGPKPGARLKGGKTSPSPAADAETLREKTRTLSPSEVKAWLEFFGGDMEV